MTAAERYTTEVELRNSAGRKFVVKHYINPEGYWWRDERMICRTCGTKPATQRLEIYDHLYQPMGSEYFCAACVPPSMIPTSE